MEAESENDEVAKDSSREDGTVVDVMPSEKVIQTVDEVQLVVDGDGQLNFRSCHAEIAR